MIRFARIQKQGFERFYRTLKILCEHEELNYTNVHYAITRSKQGFYSDDNIRVDVLYFVN